MHRRSRHPQRLLAAALYGLAGLGASPPVMAATTWLCGLSQDLVRLECIADQEPAGEGSLAAAPAAATAVVNGQRFPLDPRRRWSVDLWTPPTDLASLNLLARATVCYRSPGCQVVMAPMIQARGGVAPIGAAEWRAAR
jgi:hypothetical protein